MRVDMSVELAGGIMPGFGFFGPRAPFLACVNVNATIDRLHVYFDAGAAKDFIFPAMNYYDADGEPLRRADLIRRAKMSSTFRDETVAQITAQVIAGKLPRSSVERRPEIAIDFSAPTEISQIEVANDRGTMSRRNRHFCMTGYNQGRLVFFYRNLTPNRLIAEMDWVCTNLDVSPYDCRPDTVREALLERIDTDSLNWPVWRLAQFLPLFEKQTEMTPFRHKVCVEVMAQVLASKLRAQTTTFTPLAPLLARPRDLEAVMDDVNLVLSRRLGKEVDLLASKHMIEESVLLRKREEYLATMEDHIFPALEACGVQPMLGYGTLLGAVREGKFLAHDDDIDLIYFDGSRSHEEMLARRPELVARLRAHGLDANENYNNANFHVRHGNEVFDIFPTWEDQNSVHAMIKRPTYSAIPKSVFFPRASLKLHDRAFPAPAQPEEFLVTKYGEGWTIPDPYYGWVWPMKEDSPAA